jgi:hypothetical protein
LSTEHEGAIISRLAILHGEKFNTLNHHGAGIGTDTWPHDLGHPALAPDDGGAALTVNIRASSRGVSES